jgi:hypothetical protein
MDPVREQPEEGKHRTEVTEVTEGKRREEKRREEKRREEIRAGSLTSLRDYVISRIGPAQCG